jgi:hypothetical protein
MSFDFTGKMETGQAATDALCLWLDEATLLLTVQLPMQRPIEIYNDRGILVLYMGAAALLQQVSVAGFKGGHYLVKAGVYTAVFFLKGAP